MSRLAYSAILCAFFTGIALLLCLVDHTGYGTRRAARELESIRRAELPALADKMDARQHAQLTDVVEHFARTHDVGYTASGSQLTMLHVACLLKKPELVRCLLNDGANPNKHSTAVDSPLMMALGTQYTPTVSEDELKALADMLIAGGARTDAEDLLTYAALVCESESMLIHLMNKGIQPQADTVLPAALHGWQQALASMPESLLRAAPTALHAVALGSNRHVGRHSACAEMLLAAGVKVDAAALANDAGSTPLFYLARELSEVPAHFPYRNQALDMLVFLLSHGANAYIRAEDDPLTPGYCPYDFLTARPDLLEELAARGIVLQPPSHPAFSSGTALLTEICRAAHSGAALLPRQVEAVAAVLTPTEAMQQHELFTSALRAAVPMMARVDPAQTAAAIRGSPLWDMPAFAAQDALLQALLHTPAIVLPADFLLARAEQLAADPRRADAAAILAELLGRCPDAEGHLGALSQSSSLPLRAGALAALLRHAGLPDARNRGVAIWLRRHGREASTPFLRDALLLTSLEQLWLGNVPEAQLAPLLQLMRDIGAPTAAQVYRSIADSPTASRQGHLSSAHEWKFELEAATALYFLRHKDQFLNPDSP